MPNHNTEFSDLKIGDRIQITEIAMTRYPETCTRYKGLEGVITEINSLGVFADFGLGHYDFSPWGRRTSIELIRPRTDPTPIRSHVA